MQKIPRLTTIIDQLLKQPVRAGSVNIAVGALAACTDSEIHACWSSNVRNTPLVNAILKIQRIPAEQQCMVCFQKYNPVNQETSCPFCGSVGAKILVGEEFYLESVQEENE
ncbi:MAG: hydrogenase maturation nickel metallochaperone HypA [Chloroflexi bacterium]|nr:hydrogenase maturation nickel metallochaperone HypA [Chloroflexota bacterium]